MKEGTHWGKGTRGLEKAAVPKKPHLVHFIDIWGMIPGKQEFLTPHHVSMIAAIITVTVVTQTNVFITTVRIKPT